jgi:hypothetical protein
MIFYANLFYFINFQQTIKTEENLKVLIPESNIIIDE